MIIAGLLLTVLLLGGTGPALVLTGAGISAYHFGETSLMREYYEITTW